MYGYVELTNTLCGQSEIRVILNILNSGLFQVTNFQILRTAGNIIWPKWIPCNYCETFKINISYMFPFMT